MLSYFLKRLFLLFFTLIAIFLVVFFLAQLIPGYPAAVAKQLESADAEGYQFILENYELSNENPFIELKEYVSGLFHGDFGTYYLDVEKTIPEIFFEPLKYTLMITVPTFVISTFLGLTFGITAGYKKDKWPDIFSNFVSIFFISIPSFVLAMIFVLTSSYVGINPDFQVNERMGQMWIGLIFPILILTLTSFSGLTYYIRNEVVEVLVSDYVVVARSKGVSEFKIFLKHVLRNISIPIVTIVFPSFVGLIYGSLIIEIFFNVPGSSYVFVNAVANIEIDVIMFSVIFFTSLGLFVSLITDIFYFMLDPRIRISSGKIFSFRSKLKALSLRRKGTKNE